MDNNVDVKRIAKSLEGIDKSLRSVERDVGCLVLVVPLGILIWSLFQLINL